MQISPDNVIVTALKKAEDDSELVLRFYEWAGKETDVKIQLPSGVESVSETNLMERATSKLQVENGTVMLHTKPYEIKTVKVQFGSKSGSKAGQVANANDAAH